MSKAILTTALTGPIATQADNPSLPVTPTEIAVAACRAYEAGAAIVHVHVRDASGRPTADLDIARHTIDLIRQRCPVLVQLSTGVGLTVSYEDRARLVEARPRMATLNVCTMSFGTSEFRNPPAGVRRLAARMRELDVKPELEIYDFGHLDVALSLLAEDLLEEPLQFSVVVGVRGGMPATVENLARVAGMLPEGAAWQAVAIGRSHLPMTALGLIAGGNARTGLEDTLYLRRGQMASNEELTARLVAISRALEREPASVAEAESMLGLGASAARAN